MALGPPQADLYRQIKKECAFRLDAPGRDTPQGVDPRDIRPRAVALISHGRIQPPVTQHNVALFETWFDHFFHDLGAAPHIKKWLRERSHAVMFFVEQN